MPKKKKRKYGKSPKSRGTKRGVKPQARNSQNKRGKAKARRQAKKPQKRKVGPKRRAFLKHSRAIKKGWRRRKAKARIIKAAKAKPISKGILREYIVTWKYTGKNPRTVDFDVIARSREDALLFVIKAVARGRDSKRADLTWMRRTPWDESSAEEVPSDESETSKAERQTLGEGYVEMR